MSSKPKLLMILMLLLLSTVYTPSTAQNQSLKIVATTNIIADIVSNVAGESINVEVLMKSGTVPHEYQASLQDTELMNSADMVFYAGGGIEESMGRSLQSLVAKGKAISLFEEIPDSLKIAIDDSDELYDPHFWMDTNLTIFAVKAIAEVLYKLDPTGRDAYETNMDSYISELIALNNYTLSKIGELENNQKFLVTKHEAYNYWKRAYGFDGRSLEGTSTLDEAGIAEIDALASYLRDNRIEVIFLENSGPDDYAQAVIESARSLGWRVTIGGVLYSGSLDNGLSYIDMMKFNVNTIVDAIINPPTMEEVGTNSVYPAVSLIFVAIFIRRRNRND